MAALTKERNTKRYAGTPGVIMSYGMAASTTICGGGIVQLNSAGHAHPAKGSADRRRETRSAPPPRARPVAGSGW